MKKCYFLLVPLVLAGCHRSGERSIEMPKSDYFAKLERAYARDCDDSLGLQRLELPGIINGQRLNRKSKMSKKMAALAVQIEGRLSVYCSSPIIGTNVLLTAAHCGRVANELPVFAVFSTDPFCDLAKGRAVLRAASQVAVHEEYHHSETHPDPTNDLALIKLQAPIPAEYTGIQLAPAGRDLKAQDEVLIAGYGKTTDLHMPEPEDEMLRFTSLRPGAIPTAPSASAADIDLANRADGRFLAFNQRTNGACAGDSGGPAMTIENKELVLRGIASAVGNSTRSQYCRGYSIYNNVWFYRKWIKDRYDRLRDAESSANPYAQIPLSPEDPGYWTGR